MCRKLALAATAIALCVAFPALAKDKLKKADAELSEASCKFDVAFTPAKAGDAKFTGEFKFAVCQDEACSQVTENIEFQVAVK